MKIALAVLALSVVSGCAAVAPPEPAPAGLDLRGTDEGRAATVLASYLVARGYTVRLAGDASVEATDAAGGTFLLEVLLDPAGLDRLVLGRRYAAREGADPAGIRALAGELNAALNVGVFSAYPPGILFQSHLPFVDVLDPGVLDAFVAFTRDVGLAVARVEAGRGLLVELEGPGTSR